MDDDDDLESINIIEERIKPKAQPFQWNLFG